MLPTSTRTMESTEAKIGRSTKKCENFMSVVPCRERGKGFAGGSRAGALGRKGRHLRADLHARPYAHEAVDHDGLVALQALADDAVAVLLGPGAHGFRGDDIV